MFDTSVNDEAVTAMRIEDLASDVDTNGSSNNVDELMVRMTVARADPVRVEVVADKHQMIGIGENLAAHAGFGREGLGFVVANDAHDVSRTPSVRAGRPTKERAGEPVWFARSL